MPFNENNESSVELLLDIKIPTSWSLVYLNGIVLLLILHTKALVVTENLRVTIRSVSSKSSLKNKEEEMTEVMRMSEASQKFLFVYRQICKKNESISSNVYIICFHQMLMYNSKSWFKIQPKIKFTRYGLVIQLLLSMWHPTHNSSCHPTLST